MPVDRRRESTALSPELRAYFLDDTDMPHEAILMDDDAIKRLWLTHAGTLTAEYAAEWPGFRPMHWWKNSAPRAKLLHRGRYVEAAEPRRQISGSGLPRHDVSAYAIQFWSGLPFMSRVDPHNPPIFESSAMYLRRHDIFLPGEAEQLAPEDFEPEPLERGLWTSNEI